MELSGAITLISINPINHARVTFLSPCWMQHHTTVVKDIVACLVQQDPYVDLVAPSAEGFSKLDLCCLQAECCVQQYITDYLAAQALCFSAMVIVIVFFPIFTCLLLFMFSVFLDLHQSNFLCFLLYLHFFSFKTRSMFNQFTSGILYIFSGALVWVYFQWKFRKNF